MSISYTAGPAHQPPATTRPLSALGNEERAARYLAKLPPSVQGAGGRSALFAAATALVRGFLLTDQAALPILRIYNERAEPPWHDSDLLLKLQEAQKSTKPSGYLLKKRSATFPSTAITRPAAAPAWPTLHPLSAETLARVAELRQVSLSAAAILADCGILRAGMHLGHRCFFFCEDNYGQARRLDGLPFVVAGKKPKALAFTGCKGAFIGRRLLGGQGVTGPAPAVLLVEGPAGLLEAITVMLAVDADVAGWTVLAATSAKSKFNPEWLDRLRGRRVRIVPDRDTDGLEAAAKWTAALRTVDAVVDAELPPDGLKDLGPVAADPNKFTPFLHSLFAL